MELFTLLCRGEKSKRAPISLFLWKMKNLNQSIADVYVQSLHTKYLARQHLPLPQTDSDPKAQFLPMNFNGMYSQLRVAQHF